MCSSIGASAPGSRWIGRDDLAGDGVVQHEMALAEGAALGVLAGEPYRHALGEERGEGQRLRVGPVDAALGAECGAAPLELLAELGMHREPSGQRQELLVERHQESGASAVSTSWPAPASLCWRLRRRALVHARLEALLDVHQPLVGLRRLPLGLFGR